MIEDQSISQEQTKRTVLVVEDDNSTSDLLRAVLEREGYAVVSAWNGETGWQEYKRARPDLVLTDVVMPGMSGMNLLALIRSEDPLTPVLLITAVSTLEKAVHATKLGADAYIVKPFKVSDLRERIKEALAAKTSALAAKRLEDLSSCLIEQKNTDQKAALSGREVDEIRAICGGVAHGLRGEFLHIGSAINEIRESAGNPNGVLLECQIVQRSVEYSQLLLRRLEDFLELGMPRKERIRISELVERTELLARPRLPSTVQLGVEIAPDVQDQIVLTDIEQMIGILLELIRNASSALREKGGTITIKTKRENNELGISVEDNGPGMPEETRKNLFKKQMASKTGSGWGLYLSRRVVGAMGGTLELKAPSPEGGTAFRILLPIAGD